MLHIFLSRQQHCLSVNLHIWQKVPSFFFSSTLTNLSHREAHLLTQNNSLSHETVFSDLGEFNEDWNTVHKHNFDTCTLLSNCLVRDLPGKFDSYSSS